MHEHSLMICIDTLEVLNLDVDIEEDIEEFKRIQVRLLILKLIKTHYYYSIRFESP